jgi:hypothetical protein
MQNQNPRLYKYQVQGQMTNSLVEWARDQLEEREIDLMNTLHWEDDGGRLVTIDPTEATMSELGNRLGILLNSQI